ncbi:hypothetical protein M2407_005149 [Serratia sp. BIGb0234]|uniref:hypothetical protein n=1 Tax=Serratia sp. BIGb0234 TaxID=2940614 RepID=UPI002169CB78|nr:hypothetical protein [Serratia sp. BIGb0234]MCS4320775.1 hypothetical protein [Serratia sp. BIGb0234]
MTDITQSMKAALVPALSASEPHKQSARAVASEYNVLKKVTTFWVADHMGEDLEATAGHVYCYEINDGDNVATLKTTIVLPKISKDNSSLNPDTDIHVDVVAQPNFLRLSGKYVWVPDYNTGAIYRFKKESPDSNAEIVFFKPAKNDGKEQFHQWYDIGLQPKKDANKARIIVADGSRNTDKLSLYSIEMDDLDGALPTNGSTHNTINFFSQTLSLDMLGHKPEQFCDIAILDKKIWLYLYDSKPDNCLVLNFNIEDNGALGFDQKFTINGANGMTADPTNKYIIVGSKIGKLYKLDNTSLPGAVKSLTETEEGTIYRIIVDNAGYVWAANKSNKLYCYTALGNLVRDYTVSADGGPDSGAISIIGMAMLSTGNKLVLADNGYPQAVILTVDDAFKIQDIDLEFTKLSGEYEADADIDSVPLVTYKAGSKDRYDKATEARLQTANKTGTATAKFDNKNRALVTVPANTGDTNTKSVKFKAGPDEGSVLLLAEARTITGKKSASYILNIIAGGTITITPPDKIIIRQGKNITPATILTSSNKKSIEIDAKNGTSKVTLAAKIVDSGKPIPVVTADNKIGTAIITTKSGSKPGPNVDVLIVAIPTTIFHRALETGGDSAASIIKSVNTTKITARGREILGNNSSTVVLAAYSYIKLKLELSEKNKGTVHFLAKTASSDPLIKVSADGLSVVVKADGLGIATLDKSGVALEIVPGKKFTPEEGTNQITFEIDQSDNNDATKFVNPADGLPLQLISSH